MDVLRRELARQGLNVQAVAPGRGFEALLPGCRSALVFGSGGPLLWDRFLEWLRQDPRRLSEQDHPLDHFVEQLVSRVDPTPQGRRWVFAASDFQPRVDFQGLARSANMAWDSRLFLLLHPEFGPWLGLRAACLTTEELPVAEPLGPALCESCPSPCITACPGKAVGDRGFSWPLCALHRARTRDCQGGCLSRRACPVGSQHRYSELQLLYHSNVSVGRPALAAHLGIDDRRRPVSTDWKELARVARSMLGD